MLQLSSLEDEGRELAGKDSSPEAGATVAQMKELLSEAMNKLQTEYRSVYEMRDLQSLPGEEVAQKLGISSQL